VLGCCRCHGGEQPNESNGQALADVHAGSPADMNDPQSHTPVDRRGQAMTAGFTCLYRDIFAGMAMMAYLL
jgi:hypothetical protein